MQKRMSWLSYSKIILEKVSFDQKIFRKELRKSLARLSREEIKKLESWIIDNFNIILSYIAVTEISEYLSVQQ
ncbi:MAG: hypothetical protein KDC80_24315 [Saprospiraceae bacterium]|nr:hypothetical protein [Saprospiraceae bacterium]